jgi:hypothetical protein
MTSWVARHRAGALIALGAVVAVVVVALGAGGARTGGRYDPDNPGPYGAQAVARVLEQQGVDVTVARGADELAGARLDAGTTVVVTSTEELGRRTGKDLLRRASGADRVVLVEPEPGLVKALHLGPLPAAVTVGAGRDAACTDPTFEGLRVSVDTALAFPGEGCFPGDVGALVAERDGVTLFGPGQALTNDQVLRGDNAAAALRVLGGSDRLVWYVPSVADLGPGDGVGLGALLPDWLGPALWLVTLAAVGLVVWRARRLGPLATEPLPVVVKAIETTRSRGRLYRRSRDRAHAADTLRAATRRRLRERLRLGAGDEMALLREVARRTDRSLDEVVALLGPAPPPPTDSALVALATDLTVLDQEVRHP